MKKVLLYPPLHIMEIAATLPYDGPEIKQDFQTQCVKHKHTIKCEDISITYNLVETRRIKSEDTDPDIGAVPKLEILTSCDRILETFPGRNNEELLFTENCKNIPVHIKTGNTDVCEHSDNPSCNTVQNVEILVPERQNSKGTSQRQNKHQHMLSEKQFQFYDSGHHTGAESVSGDVSSVKSHLLTHTGEKAFKCDICRKIFSRRSHLKIHLLTHTGERAFKCDVCRKLFSQKSSLKTHLLTHTGEKPFQCDVCSRAFSQRSSLKTHLLTHTGEKPFRCDIRSRTFSFRGNLKTHLLRHTREKAFQFDVCNKSFSLRRRLKIHLRTHTGEKAFQCDICSRTFSERSTFKSHVLTLKGEKAF